MPSGGFRPEPAATGQPSEPVAAGGPVGDGAVSADAPGDGTSLTEVFTAARPRLVGLAYRITGSRIDAEDMVQEAWLRSQRVDWSTIERPEAWLTTVVSRLALDHLRSAAHRRERYVGPWLPEPIRADDPGPAAIGGPGAPPGDPADLVELSESLTFGFLRLLDTLSPVERVVFLLADLFDMPYKEIGAVVGRRAETCRQIASRARRHVRAGRVRHDRRPEAERVAAELLRAVGAGDVDRAMSLLADDVVLLSDGGPEAHAARRPVRGPDRVGRLLVNIGRRYAAQHSERATINGEPGVVIVAGGRTVSAVSVEVAGGRVHAVHVVVNPGKLAALDVTTAIV
jgi:RNA polymerase sigma-70 factor (ECF subfamily)